ncbi:MAG: hypothetical protein ACQ5SW_08310 [Sphaerochaetaceae bacterium]
MKIRADGEVDGRYLRRGIYAVYKGEEFITEGTVEELAEYFNVRPDTVRWWSSPTNAKRGKKRRKIAVKIGSLEEEVMQ